MPRPPHPPATAYIGLGANLGDRAAALRQAVLGLAAHPEVTVAGTSSIYETAPHTLRPGERQPAYLNAVVQVRTTLPPRDLLALCHDLEQRAGRRRPEARRWAPRPLDLDLLLYDERTCATPGLTLPHPRLHERRFVLAPLAELAPDVRVPPPPAASAAELLARCPDPDVPVRLTPLLTPASP